MRLSQLFPVSILAVVSSLAPLSTGCAQAPALTRETLGDGIYLFRAPSTLDLWTATNVVVIINERDVTVFDSFTRAATARMVIAEIRKLTDKPVRTLINSHWHQDHWSGNNEFAKAFPGIQIIATTESRDYMKRMPGGFFAASLARSAAASRVALDSAIRSGKEADGTPLTAEERQAGVTAAVTRFRQMLVNAPENMPRIMPMTAAIAPEFARRYPRERRVFVADRLTFCLDSNEIDDE